MRYFCKMSPDYEKYEVIIGLEVHAQLLTASKLFCDDSTAFGAEPNLQVSPVSLGHPGTLPVLNRKAIEYAIKMGLACHSQIQRNNHFARKNYFYPDLPKGYQISQHTAPICSGGFVRIRTGISGKTIELNRIHLEEDAGKSLHDLDENNSCIDFNRAGMPLIEIVTEPCIRSADEAHAYLTELRKILRYLKVCDGNMEEGSLRCDVNISIRLKGQTKLGTKAEIKNLNSLRHVKQAIDFESARMIKLAENNGKIEQETRSFDPSTGTSFALRSKEEADDYRYFADPDLPPFIISDSLLDEIRAGLPELPEELVARYTSQLKLSEYDARVISDDKEMADYFDQLIKETNNYKAAANWLLGPVKSYLNDKALDMAAFRIRPPSMAKLIHLVEEGKINFSIASSRIFPEMIREPESDPLEIAMKLNLLQNSDADEIAAWVEEVLGSMPDKVAEYKKGKKGLIGLFVGEVKRISKGKADPALTNRLLLQKLDKRG
jgi:aspartyl-tRNA(Asn)/glutamyl-tRNA(Gln) amidotransferase subunit B